MGTLLWLGTNGDGSSKSHSATVASTDRSSNIGALSPKTQNRVVGPIIL